MKFQFSAFAFLLSVVTFGAALDLANSEVTTEGYCTADVFGFYEPFPR